MLSELLPAAAAGLALGATLTATATVFGRRAGYRFPQDEPVDVDEHFRAALRVVEGPAPDRIPVSSQT